MNKNLKAACYKILVCICILLCSKQGYSQPDERVSSKVSINYDLREIDLLLDTANRYINSSPQKSFDYVEDALELSIRNRDSQREAKSYNMLGKVNYNLQQYDLAIDYFNKAARIWEELKSNAKYDVYLNLARAFEKNGNLDESLDYYEKYLGYANKTKNTDKIIAVKQDLARVYTDNKEYDKAVQEYNEVLKLEEERNNPSGIVTANTQIGEAYMSQQNTKAAISKYKKAVEVAEQTKDTKLQSSSLRNLGNAYRSNKQYNEELEVRQQSLQINEEAQKIEEQAEDNMVIGEIYVQKQQPEEAVKYLQQSINLANKSGSIEKKSIALKTLSEAFKDQGVYDKALLAYKEYATLVDSINNQRERELKANLEIVAAVSRKLQRIELLEKDFQLSKRTVDLLQKEKEFDHKELRTQKKITYSLIFVILVLIAASYFVYRSFIEKRRANLLLALKSLRSQMNPHFIFNSLNSVNSFIAQNNERMANKYLSEFSMLMRMVLENSKHDFVPVTSEIEIISLYLKLEHFRFKDKFDYVLDVDEKIRISEFEIPPMLIQPYIENAIWHGLRYKESKGLLQVSIKKKDDFVYTIICDDGIGRKKSQEVKTKHQMHQSSTGLRNTINRLDIINEVYKTHYSVTIEDLNKEEESGTRVEIKIPYTNVVPLKPEKF